MSAEFFAIEGQTDRVRYGTDTEPGRNRRRQITSHGGTGKEDGARLCLLDRLDNNLRVAIGRVQLEIWIVRHVDLIRAPGAESGGRFANPGSG